MGASTAPPRPTSSRRRLGLWADGWSGQPKEAGLRIYSGVTIKLCSHFQTTNFNIQYVTENIPMMNKVAVRTLNHWG